MNQPAMIQVPVEPPVHVKYAHSLGRGMLIREQLIELSKPINPQYVEKKQRMTYLSQHQARAEMNRIFGYGNWDVLSSKPVLLREVATHKAPPGGGAPKEYWTVTYQVETTVVIRDLWGMEVARYTGVHAEENAPQPNYGEAHALAVTSVDSYAFRRAVINLGDRFGLGLYDNGSMAPHGRYTIQLQDGIIYRTAPIEAPRVPQEQLPPAQPAPTAPAPAPAEQSAQPNLPPVVQRSQENLTEFHAAAAHQQAGRDAMRERLANGLKTDAPEATNE